MREKDAVSNVFFQDPARIADLLNGFIYHGEQVVSAADVQERGDIFPDAGKYLQSVGSHVPV